jgi:hypothetical protein
MAASGDSMGAITPNLRLNVPDFDQVPWDADVNSNWHVLDATVGMFTAIPDLVGVWKNSTAYVYGQSVIDSVDSSIWTCVQSHTSSATPAIFSVERTQYPARWTQTAAGAQFYATQAASSASSASASATAAQNAAASVGLMLPLAGGTMTGALILRGDPVNMLEPATRQYVDARVGGTGYLPIGGGTLTGPLTVGGSGVTYAAAGANAHAFAFGWTGSGAYFTVDGTYIGSLATQSFLASNYLPISGGTVTGTLVVNGEVQVNAVLRLTSSGAYFYSSASETIINWDSGNWTLRYNRSNGTLTYRRSDGLNLLTIDGGGTVSAAANVNVGSALVTAGNSYTRGGTIYWGAGDRSRLMSDNSSYTNIYFLDNYCFNLNWSTGGLAWFRYDNTPLFTISVAGHIWAAGNAAFGGNVSGGDIHASGTLYAVNDHMVIGNGAAGRILQMEPNWYWSWNSTNGDMNWVTPSGAFFEIRNHDGLCGNDLGAMYGNGAYIIYSDERTKVNIQPSSYGLAEIAQLEPIKFSRQSSPDRVEHGFSAQQVQRIMPHAVAVVGTQEEEPTLGITLDPIVAGLVNAVKTIIERLDQQESTSGTTTH